MQFKQLLQALVISVAGGSKYANINDIFADTLLMPLNINPEIINRLLLSYARI